MLKRIITAALLVLTAGTLTAGNLTLNEQADGIINELRDAVFHQEMSDGEIHALYFGTLEDLEGISLPDPERYYYLSLTEYWMGRAYQSFDETATVVSHHAEIQKGHFLKLQSYYTAKDQAVSHYETALDYIEEYLDIREDSEGYRQYSEVQGQLILLKPVSYVLTNGLSVKRTLKKSLKMDPANVKSLIMDGASDIYTPAKYGGDADKGIELLKQALEMNGTDREDRFNIYTGIAYGLITTDRPGESQVWLKRAGEIYPRNIYLSGLMQIAREGN